MKINFCHKISFTFIILLNVLLSGCSAYTMEYYTPSSPYETQVFTYYHGYHVDHPHYHYWRHETYPAPYANPDLIQPGPAPAKIQPGPSPYRGNSNIQPGPSPYK